MDQTHSSRRLFLKQSAFGVGGVLLTTLLPRALLAAHREARAAAAAGEKFAFLTPVEAADVKAFASQVIPTDDTPGANEANVVYFIDNVLTKYEPQNREMFRTCLTHLNDTAARVVPGTDRFASLKPEQQIEVMKKFQDFIPNKGAEMLAGFFGGVSSPFETMRQYVIAGFLSDPDNGGNKDMVGWQLIAFDGMGMHEPPFGYYDAELLKQRGNGE